MWTSNWHANRTKQYSLYMQHSDRGLLKMTITFETEHLRSFYTCLQEYNSLEMEALKC